MDQLRICVFDNGFRAEGELQDYFSIEAAFREALNAGIIMVSELARDGSTSCEIRVVLEDQQGQAVRSADVALQITPVAR